MIYIEKEIDILSFLQKQGIINLDDVHKCMRKEEISKILQEHHYDIWQGKNERWYSHLPDKTQKSGRRKIVKSSKESLEKAIVKYYEEEKEQIELVTLRTIFPKWIQSRGLEVNCVGTARRNFYDWKRYYLNDPIIDISMEKLTVQKLKDWAHKKIEDNSMTKRRYYNMAIIIKQCYEFAKDSELINHNIWADVKINTKKFERESKKENVTQIYFYDEQYKIVEYALSLFSKEPKNISALTIPLLFLTGMRIGEVVALKYEDIKDDFITVRQSESTVYKLDNDGNFIFSGQEVVDHAKTQAGERNIPYTKGAKQIISMVQESSNIYKYYDDGYVFCPRSQRVKAGTIDKKLYRYCDAVGMPKKSAHKIRKTYISKLINDGRLDIDTICRVAGHVDLKTTFDSYCFGLEEKEIIHDKFEMILGDKQCNQV